MKKILLLCVMVLLTACAEPEENQSVAQMLPKEEKEPLPTFDSKVEIYTTNGATTGFVIAEDERNKWILTNAQDVSHHPNVLIHDELMLLGEVQGIDVEQNMAIIHMRNSHQFHVMKLVETPVVGGVDTTTNEMQYFATVSAAGESIDVSKNKIETLLKQTKEKPLTWQQRYEKNAQLQAKEMDRSNNPIGSYYSKNIFTYNPDELKNFAMDFVTQLNEGIAANDLAQLKPFVASDDVLENLEYVKEPIKKFKIKDARKEGVYYFVNGMDAEKNDVRLTMMKQQQFQVIGTNLIEESKIKDEKTPVITLQKEAIEEQKTVLQLFIRKHLSAINFKSPADQSVIQLEHQDKKVNAKIPGEKKPLKCDQLVVHEEEKNIQLVGCTGGNQEQFTWAYE